MRSRLWSSIFLLSVSSPTRASSTPFGWQSGRRDDTPELQNEALNDDSYAGSAAYDRDRDLLYLTGATYGGWFDAEVGSGADERLDNSDDFRWAVHTDQSDCFLAAVSLPSGPDPPEVELLVSSRFGTAGSPEACGAVGSFAPNVTFLEPGNEQSLVVLGHTQESGLLTDLREEGTEKATVYGYALDVSLDLSAAEVSTTIKGGRLFHEQSVEYPIAVAIPPRDRDGSLSMGQEVFYVASMATDDERENHSFDSANRRPDLTTKDGTTSSLGLGHQKWRKYGRDFFVTVKKVRRKARHGIGWSVRNRGSWVGELGGRLAAPFWIC